MQWIPTNPLEESEANMRFDISSQLSHVKLNSYFKTRMHRRMTACRRLSTCALTCKCEHMVDWIFLRAVGVLFKEIEPASQKQSIIDFAFVVCQSAPR